MKIATTAEREILVLPSWYPSRLNSFAGDFVQRHIAAIALFQKQYVLHVVKDTEGKITQDVTSHLVEKENYREEIIYYHPRRTGIALLDKFLSDYKYYRVYKKAVQNYLASNGNPLMTHLHLAMKAGPIALWLKKAYNIPYVLTEHWTAYLPEADLQLKDHKRIFVKRSGAVIKNADAVTVVSEHLGQAIRALYPSLVFKVIPNVVDTRLFYPKDFAENTVPYFIHASTFSFQKNIDDILKAFQIVKEKNLEFKLYLFGSPTAGLKQKVAQVGLSNEVSFEGEVSQEKLALAMQAASALVLYSRFETFGCVIAEANAAGIPVIVSDIPVFHELVEEGVNGFFVAGEAPAKLAEVLIDFIIKPFDIRPREFTKKTEKFTFEVVGNQFFQLYQRMLAD